MVLTTPLFRGLQAQKALLYLLLARQLPYLCPNLQIVVLFLTFIHFLFTHFGNSIYV